MTSNKELKEKIQSLEESLDIERGIASDSLKALAKAESKILALQQRLLVRIRHCMEHDHTPNNFCTQCHEDKHVIKIVV